METESFKEGDVIGTAKIVYSGRVKPVPMEDDREPDEIELSRLEREVIEQAKAARRAQKLYLDNITFDNAKVHYETWETRDRAVDALIDFESKQQQIKSK